MFPPLFLAAPIPSVFLPRPPSLCRRRRRRQTDINFRARRMLPKPRLNGRANGRRILLLFHRPPTLPSVVSVRDPAGATFMQENADLRSPNKSRDCSPFPFWISEAILDAFAGRRSFGTGRQKGRRGEEGERPINRAPSAVLGRRKSGRERDGGGQTEREQKVQCIFIAETLSNF